MKLDLKICLVFSLVFNCFIFSNDLILNSTHTKEEEINSSIALTPPTIEVHFVGLSTIDTLPDYINPSDALSGILVDVKVNGGLESGNGTIESVILNWQVNSLSANTFMSMMPELYNLLYQDWHYIKRIEPYGNGTKVFWWVTAQNIDGEMSSTEIDSFLIGTLNVSSDFRPSKFIVLGNYPNPFNPATKINFTVDQPSFISVSIFSLTGRSIRQFNLNITQPGNKSIIWNGKDMIGNDVPSGIYMYRIQSGEYSEFKKMTLLR